MINWIKKSKFYKQLFEGKEGASFVSVVIGTVFLMTLGITILTVSTRYLVTVYVDRNSTDNFYTTEGVLEEVRTGLIELANNAAEDAYDETMENYTSSSASLEDVFGVKYMSLLASEFLGYEYTTDEVEDEDNLGKLVACPDQDTFKNLTNEPDAVTNAPGTSELAIVINYEAETGYTLTLKNLFVNYEDSAKYRSSINSDIVFKVPDYKFQGDSILEEMKNYIVINDDQLNVEMTSGGASFTGNVYTGQADSGINIADKATSTFNSKKIITRGSLDAGLGANVSITGETGAGSLWAQNIRLLSSSKDSSLSTKFTMNENAYISNDFDVQSNNSVISLSGKYYGYSYNEANSTALREGMDPNYSSAILINGINTTLDGSGLDKLFLAGRAFVSRYNSSLDKVEPLTDEGYSATKDVFDNMTGSLKTQAAAVLQNRKMIATGESLSVKSNQLAYLVPDSYIANGSTKIEHNPLATSELTTAIENAIKTNLLNDAVLSDYLDDSNPFIKNYNSDGYVYLFLNFASEKKANKFFLDYYNGDIDIKDETGLNSLNNQRDLVEKAQTYLTTTDMFGSKFSGNLLLVAANIVNNYEESDANDTDTNSSIVKSNYYNAAGEPRQNLLNDGRKISAEYLGKCRTLLTSGNTGVSGRIRLNPTDDLSADDADYDKPLVSYRIIDFSGDGVGAISGSMSKDYTDELSGVTSRITVVDGDYEVTSAGRGTDINTMVGELLIVNGDVTVSSNFRGLILSNGKVSVEGDHILHYDMVSIGNVISEIEKDSDADGETYRNCFWALKDGYNQSTNDMNKCVTYQNWVKNEY